MNSPAEDPSWTKRAGSSAFPATHWSIVLGAGVDDMTRATAALERLCRTYWYPIYAFIRRRGSGPQDAEDLTQSFFAFLLERETLKKVDRSKGKFRTFILAALTNFLSNEWDKRQTLKRGGQSKIISLDETEAEGRYFREPVESVTPETLFERRWAAALIEQVLGRLREEYAAAGKSDVFAKLEPALTREVSAGDFTQWAGELGVTEGAAKVALHRLRRRFGEVLRSEIAHTVSSPEEIDEELRHLFPAISAL